MRNERKNIAVIIPAYNEGSKIAEVLSGLAKTHYRVILIDDGSTDNTYQVASGYPIHLLRHPFNLGQGAAIQTGLEYALSLNSDIMVTFDADGQHCLEDIEVVAEPILSSAKEVVFGSRFLGKAVNMSLIRRQCVLLMTRFSNSLSGIVLSDANCGIRAFSRNAVSHINITQNRMAHTLEIIEQVNEKHLPYAEVPVTIKYTDYSLRKGQHLSEGIHILFDWIMRL